MQILRFVKTVQSTRSAVTTVIMAISCAHQLNNIIQYA